MIAYLYIVAIHSSIAMMEILGWMMAAYGYFYAIVKKPKVSKIFIKKYRRVLIALGMLVIWVAVSLVSTPLEKPFLFQFGFMRWTALLVGLTFALKAIWSEAFERRLIQVWSFALLVTGLYAGLQFFTGIDLIRPGRGLVNPQGVGLYKAVGFFSMSLTYAYVFGISAFGICRRSGLVFGALSPWILAGISGLGLLASMSKGAWIASVVAIGIFLADSYRKWFLPFVIAVAVGVFGVAHLNDAVGYKILQLAGLRVDSSANTRIDLWRAYGEMFKDHPITGVGLLEGDKLLGDYFFRLNIDQPFHSHAHNVYLQWLAGAGLPGFLLYMYVAWFFLSGSWRLRKRDGWGYGLFLAQIFCHLGALTEANFFDGEVNHALIFIWAITWLRMDEFKVVSPASKP